MIKTDDKFCPDCGHHLYITARWYYYWCVDCQAWVEIPDALTLEQAQPLRVGYDASARKEQDE